MYAQLKEISLDNAIKDCHRPEGLVSFTSLYSKREKKKKYNPYKTNDSRIPL